MIEIRERSTQEMARYVAQLEVQVQMLNDKVEWLESQLRLAVQRRFTPSREGSDSLQ